jgi:hypothetical protein
MAWIYRNDIDEFNKPVAAPRVVADLASTTKGDGFQIRFSQKEDTAKSISLCLFINPSGSSDYVETKLYSQTDGTFSPGECVWHHIAIAFDNSKATPTSGTANNTTTAFYIDGKYVTHNPDKTRWNYRHGKTINLNNTPLTIGCSSGSDSYEAQFVGFIDDLILFNNWNPNTDTLDDGRNKDVAFWMDIDDSGHRELDIDEGIKFGEFNPRTTIYTANQITNIFHAENIPVTETDLNKAIDFGQFDPNVEIYSCESVDNLVDDHR